MPPNPKAWMAGLLGLFGGLPVAKPDVPRPSVDQSLEKVTFARPRQRLKISRGYALAKHKRQIAHASRKKNLLRNGTRG